MSESTFVSIVWGIQIETIPLLLAVGAYEASEPARLFFSLLHLRARSSTLVFTPLSARRATIASFPIEVVEEILAHVHLSLCEPVRDALRIATGDCFCSQGNRYVHGCGIDCLSWTHCCMLGEEDYFDRDLDWNRTRRGKFMSELSKWWIPKIIKIASLFKLDVVVHPSFSDNRDNRADLLDTIIGIPFTPTSTTLDSSATTDATSSLSSLAPDEDMPTASHTLSLVGRLQLTTRERRRFTRLVRLLHLEDEYNWGGAIQKPSGSSLGPISPEESRKQWKKRRGDPDVGYWLGSGEMSLEPALLMAHASGYFW